MTFNAELCNYTLSFVRAINHIELGQTRAIITYVQQLFDHPKHIYLDFVVRRRYLSSIPEKEKYKASVRRIKFHAIKLTINVYHSIK